MWSLVNRTRFAAERTFARDPEGAEVLVVAVKGTFDIHPDGATSVAEQQVPLCRVPVFRDPHPQAASSLLYEADLLLDKPATDVLVHGRAHAPGGAAATQVEVGLRVGPVAKRVLVLGDRRWEQGMLGLRLTEPQPFVTMPLLYERAFGGIVEGAGADGGAAVEARNPVGRGFAKQAADLAGRPAPNLEDPAARIGRWDDRPRPVGMGPIARHWAPRVALAGTHDAQWERARMPLPPRDFQLRFHQCAPEDQQVPGYLRGGEVVELRNLTPGGSLRFALPSMVPGFTVHIRGGKETHPGNLHTVIVEPDEGRVILVWHLALPCHDAVYSLKRVVVEERTPPPGSAGAPRQEKIA